MQSKIFTREEMEFKTEIRIIILCVFAHCAVSRVFYIFHECINYARYVYYLNRIYNSHLMNKDNVNNDNMKK